MVKREESVALYSAKWMNTEKARNEPYEIGVFRGEEQIGSYKRNYALMRTFFAFDQGGEWYALYSRSYTTTRIMKLPECIDLGGEEPESTGFCPVDFYVPTIENEGLILMNDTKDEHWRRWDENVRKASGTFGFVFGCHWACPYEVQYLDLSEASQGIIKREPRWDRDLEIPDDMTLEEAIEIEENHEGNPRGMIISVKKFVLL